jgi:Tfp pilus assembly protein PilF
VEKDPDYALAYTGIASAYMDIAGIEGKAEATAKARAAAEKAKALDDSLPEAHLACGNVFFRGDWDWLAAEREFDRALELDPRSSLAHWYMALLSLAMGHKERGVAEMVEAQLLDPASESLHDDLGWTYYLNRRYSEAVAESKMAVALDPESISAHHQLGKDYLRLRKFEEATAEFRITLKLNDIRRGLADLGQLYALSGKTAQARAVLDELKRSDGKRRTYETEYMRSVLLASLGDKDAAFQQLEAAVARKLSRSIWMRVDPDLDPIRSDARFDALLRRVHLLN